MNRVLRFLTSIPLAVMLYALLLFLGLISLVWNIFAMLIHPVMPAAPARALGRMTIAFAYRMFWWLASVTGMMRIDAAASTR